MRVVFSLRQVLILFFFILMIPAISFSQHEIPPDLCLTQEEYRLYTLINDYRTSKGLPVIPISKSLSYVAKIHVRDLYHNHPDTSFCNLNSWSDKGPWTSCCHSKYTPNPDCIFNKPKELTSYKGEGHELCYWDSENVSPDTVFRFWRSVEQTRDVILGQRKWTMYSWKAIGVGLYDGYACVWVGDQPDIENEPVICPSDSAAETLKLPQGKPPDNVITAPANRYYVIFGSFTTMEEAKRAVEIFKEQGFYLSKVLVKENSYRVTLSDHATMQEAKEFKSKLGEKYKEAWIIKF